MPLSRGLALWLYPVTYQSNPAQALRDYRPLCTSLEFTTASPGGFGTLTATLNLTAKHLARPELQLFARVALMARGEPVFLGEISEISISGTEEYEAVSITALGVGNCLRDDPANFAYVNKTALQIITDQFLYGRSAHNYPISTTDLSQVFPDNPATVYDNLSYASRTIEEILNDLCTLAGSYAWTCYDHPTSRDSAGFPLGRLNVHIKDTTTTNYIASIDRREVMQYEVAKSADRAYNLIQVDYNTPSAGAPSFVTATDSRLAGDGSIGIADFRRRKYARALTGNSTANSTNATTVANTLLNQYKTAGNKVSLSLRAVRDNNDAPIPLYAVRADANIWVRDIAGRGAQAPIGAVAGVNQFYIIQTTYRESEEGASLELICDNYSNAIDVIMARLQYAQERAARNGSKTAEMVQALGAVIKGWANISAVATASSQAFALQGTSFRPILYQAPTSISWAAAAFQTNNTGSPTVNNITQYGFHAFVNSTAGGATSYGGNFTTVGNCIYGLDLEAGTFTHHHGACGLRREGLSIEKDIIAEIDAAGQPSMRIECPCGGGESYNMNLGHLRERDGEQIDDGKPYNNSEHDAEQTRHIRALMRHPSVGLHQYVRNCQCDDCQKPIEKPKKPRARKGPTKAAAQLQAGA